MLISSVGTIYACGWTEGWKNEFAIVLFELLVENATFYPAAWVCGRLLPKLETKNHEDPLEGMVIVEAIDIFLRFACFWLALRYPDIKGLLTGAGSVTLDGLFLVSISNSHRLVEIFGRLGMQFSFSSAIIKVRHNACLVRPDIISLTFWGQPVAV